MHADPLATSLHADLPEPTESMELVARAKAGDQAALSRLLERYQDRLRRIVRVRIGSRLRGELESMDIVQEAFQVACRKIQDLEPRGPGSILNWLARIAEHKIHDANDYRAAQKRDREREAALEVEGRTAGSSLAACTTQPDERAARAELRELLDEALSGLAEDHREVILLRDYCGASFEEVARALDRPNSHAAQELHRRAWIKLRRAVRPLLRGAE